MSRLVLVLAVAGALGACAPPRSASYFEEHPDDAAKVLAGCATGEHRGEECANAQAGQAAAARKARMDAYRKNF